MLWWELRKLKSAKLERRRRLHAIEKLGYYDEPRSVKALIAVIKGDRISSAASYSSAYPSDDERVAAINSIGRLKAAAAVPELLPMLSGRFSEQAEGALLNLGQLAVPPAAARLKAPETPLDLRRGILSLLRKLSWKPTSARDCAWNAALDGKYAESLADRLVGQEVLIALLHEGSPDEIASISSDLLKVNPDKDLKTIAADSIFDRLKNFHGEAKWVSVVALARLQDKRAIALLKGFLFTDDGKYWNGVLKHLSELGCDPIAEVIDFEQHVTVNYDERTTARNLLASTGDVRVLEALVKAIRDGIGSEEGERAREFVRVNAGQLQRSKVHEFIEFLIPVLDASYARRRDDARDVLVALLEWAGARIAKGDLERLAGLTYTGRVEKKWVACEIYDEIEHGVDCVRLRQLAKQLLAQTASF